MDRNPIDSGPAFKPEILEVLLALVDGPLHGFGLVQAVEEQTGGRMVLAPSLLYRRLNRLLGDGLIEDAGMAEGERGKPRHLYKLTVKGRRALASEAARLQELARSERIQRVLQGPGSLAGGAGGGREGPGGS